MKIFTQGISIDNEAEGPNILFRITAENDTDKAIIQAVASNHRKVTIDYYDCESESLGIQFVPADEATYYGPYPCEECSRMIVRTGKEWGGKALNKPEGPVYPNTVWQTHEHGKQKVHDVVTDDDCYYCNVCHKASGDGDGLIGKYCDGIKPPEKANGSISLKAMRDLWNSLGTTVAPIAGKRKASYAEIEKEVNDAKGRRYYGDGGTIHGTTYLDIETFHGTVVAVWFRCQPLPFQQAEVKGDRARGMERMYGNPKTDKPYGDNDVEIHGLDIKDKTK